MTDTEVRMPLTAHLAELRKRLVVALIAVALGAIVLLSLKVALVGTLASLPVAIGVALLLANRADPNAPDADGQTPLQAAATNGFKDAAELLRQHGGH